MPNACQMWLQDCSWCRPLNGGDVDAGAVDGKGDDKIYEDEIYTEESELVLEYTKLLKARLEGKYDILLTRHDDTFIPLHCRTDIADANHGDLFISVHANSFFDNSVEGVETLYYPTSTNGRQLAKNVQNNLIQTTGAVDRGIKGRSNLYVLKKTASPAILIELGFISNPEEEERLHSNYYMNKAVDGIVEGINKYIERG